MDAIAQSHRAAPALRAAAVRIEALLRERGAHPARTVVLVPFGQLIQAMRAQWMALCPQGFAPRIETTMNWARGAGGFLPSGDDIAFDMARDLLTAQALLERAGLGARRDALAARLVEAAQQLAELARAVAPAARAAWAAQMRAVVASGLDAPALALEAAVARVALEWAAASSYATDALLQANVADGLDCLVVLEGFQAEPLVEALKALFGAKAVSLPLDVPAPQGDVALHEALDPEDEAARAAACVLRHIEAGRMPVALAATDRALTRRIRALLGSARVAMRDETGWKLSTTRAAAHVMGALRACAWDAPGDGVLDWLKNARAFDAGAVSSLERHLRRNGARRWRSVRVAGLPKLEAAAVVVEQAARLRDTMQAARPLASWMGALRELLQAAGQWEQLEGDAAGGEAIGALRLNEGAQAEFAALPQAARRMSLSDFTAWANAALEAASFRPAHAGDAQVAILPLSQVLGMPFAAIVVPGCDEVRLNPSPEPAGPWTAAQRLALGMPSREALEAARRAEWRHALQVPHADVLWRSADESGEPLLPSVLVQQLQLAAGAQPGAEPRERRDIARQPTPEPMPRGDTLPVAQLSASAYEDLRRCPYRFFALRQLGLQEAEEIDTEIDKRDFGNWLHAVLSAFHEALVASPEPDGAARLALIETAAAEVTRDMRLDDGEFLPFSAAWPRVRDGYLDWLAKHEATGATFGSAESRHETQIGPLKLMGRIDRIDGQPQGGVMVMDYKTESLATTRDRIRQPTEDTQLAFYAALLPHDTLRAGYVNIGEKETRLVEQEHVVQARDALVQGMLDDMRRIGEGEAMPALGEGTVCDFCAARGLCRKDFREGAP